MKAVGVESDLRTRVFPSSLLEGEVFPWEQYCISNNIRVSWCSMKVRATAVRSTDVVQDVLHLNDL